MTAAKISEKFFQGRKEVQGLTIDGPASRDLDDAIWLEKKGKDYVIHVSITDAGSQVGKGSVIDRRAFRRGFTRYYSNDTRQMLTESLSNYTLSLSEGNKKPTITVSVPVSENLKIGEPEIRRTYIVSKMRLSYEQADGIMETDKSSMLNESFRLAKKLYELRRANGALVYFDRKKGITTSEEGNPVILDKTERYNSHLLIQEFMVLANQSVAGWLARNNVPGLFRNHVARSAAPKREDILSEISAVLTEGNPNRISTLRQMLNLVLEKAFYAPTISGHYGLNLPAYVHFTSPIRRYADLVNNRQLSAALLGEELPYTAEELNAVAERLNKLEKEEKEGKSEHFKEKSRRETRKTIITQQVENLDSRDFYRVIKVGIRESLITPEIAGHIIRRLEEGLLQARDIFIILFESDRDDKNWAKIREKVMKWLEKNPHESVSVLILASQNAECSAPIFKKSSIERGHQKGFTCVGSLIFEGTEYSSDPQAASSKKAAEHLACLNLLEKMMGVESKQRTVFKSGEEKTVTYIHPTENYKSHIQMRCQEMSWPLPEYRMEQTGPSHQPEFTVIAELDIEGVTYSSDPCKGPNRKHAEQLAAGSLLEKLPEGKKVKKDSLKVISGNYIGALQELFQKRRLNLPTFEFNEKGKGFECTCTALAPDGTEKTYTAEGTSKKVAKTDVAQKAFEDLLPLYKQNQ